MWDEPNVRELRSLRAALMQSPERASIHTDSKTVATEVGIRCVTTHLPNESAPKMDGAQVPRIIYFRYSTDNAHIMRCCQVGGRVKVVGKLYAGDRVWNSL